jgi:uncharacterized protein YfaS (alpha-2-macroglobulin family)
MLSLTPSTLSQVVQGLEGQLQAPYGCFEQTSSITYPNILILDYLKTHQSATPEIQIKAQQFIGLGYQRILTFETPGGGFDWYGSPPAKTVLTAYGVMELHDMARVYPVDDGLIQRAQSVLVNRQQADGSWNFDIAAHTWGNVEDKFNVTAYVTWALAYAGSNPASVGKGLRYLEQHANEAKDNYTLALIANAFATARPDNGTTHALLDRLTKSVQHEKDGVYWVSSQRTLTYGYEDTSTEEATALACQAYLRAGYKTDNAENGLRYLIRHRSSGGAWSTTQSTILTLQALALADLSSSVNGNGTILVKVNGIDAATIKINKENADVMQQVDLSSYLTGTSNTVALSVKGDIAPVYQLTSEWYEEGKSAPPVTSPLKLSVVYDKSSLLRNEMMTAHVALNLVSVNSLDMVMVDIGVPPGFTPDQLTLQKAVDNGVIAKYQINPRQVTLYLRGLDTAKPFLLNLPMRAKYPVHATTPSSDAYEYYTPSNRTEINGGMVNVL